MKKLLKFFVLAAGIVFLIFIKVSQIMSNSKLIYSRCLDAGFPVTLALLIVAQSKHETAFGGVAFTSPLFLRAKNGFGYGRVAGNKLQIPGGAGSHPEDSGVYAKYATFSDSIDDVIGYYQRRKAIFFPITTSQKFAEALKTARYFTGATNVYAGGLKKFYKNLIV